LFFSSPFFLPLLKTITIIICLFPFCFFFVSRWCL